MDFEQAYQELFTPLYRYVFLRTRNRDESLDVVQAIFTRLFEKYRKYPISEIRRLMYRSAKNELIDRGRRKKPEYLDPADPALLQIPETVPHDGPRAYEQQETIALVHDLLDQLDEAAQEIITMKFFEEMDYPTIADRLNKSEAAIRQVVSRSLKKMSHAYESRTKNN